MRAERAIIMASGWPIGTPISHLAARGTMVAAAGQRRTPDRADLAGFNDERATSSIDRGDF
ncbi:MAG: hypothetical protein GYA24_21330 [Candidatus Lokiarchaeota archaeon]|nr:hypothetical protein [Candidatus Lokiarchaeota archaeon]